MRHLEILSNAASGVFRGALDLVVLFGEDALRNSIHQFLDHYHQERNHQGLDNRLIIPLKEKVDTEGRIERRERLGGLLNYYYRAA